jgi:hypothetical protein
VPSDSPNCCQSTTWHCSSLSVAQDDNAIIAAPKTPAATKYRI